MGGEDDGLGGIGEGTLGVFEEGIANVVFKAMKGFAEGGADADEFGEGEVLGGAFGEPGGDLFVNGIKMASEGFELGLLGAEEAFFDVFQFEEPEFVDAGPDFLVPMVEGGSRDADLFGDPGDGEALDAEFNELVYGIGVMHNMIFWFQHSRGGRTKTVQPPRKVRKIFLGEEAGTNWNERMRRMRVYGKYGSMSPDRDGGAGTHGWMWRRRVFGQPCASPGLALKPPNLKKISKTGLYKAPFET